VFSNVNLERFNAKRMEERKRNNEIIIYEGAQNKYGQKEEGKATKVYIYIYVHICIFTCNSLPKLH
jgi:hypothetical protein